MLGVGIRFICGADETGQAWSLMENIVPKDAGAPPHYHPWDEACCVGRDRRASRHLVRPLTAIDVSSSLPEDLPLEQLRDVSRNVAQLVAYAWMRQVRNEQRLQRRAAS